jgi:molecular chaperone DnaK (HSP70)
MKTVEHILKNSKKLTISDVNEIVLVGGSMRIAKYIADCCS